MAFLNASYYAVASVTSYQLDAAFHSWMLVAVGTRSVKGMGRQHAALLCLKDWAGHNTSLPSGSLGNGTTNPEESVHKRADFESPIVLTSVMYHIPR